MTLLVRPRPERAKQQLSPFLFERLEGRSSKPRVLVLAPTRELAMQVADSFKAYAAGHPHLNVLAIYGGSDFRSQIHTLKRGVDVVVGTPEGDGSHAARHPRHHRASQPGAR